MKVGGASGSFPDMTQEELDAAKIKFLDDVHAPSHKHVVEAKLKTIQRALALWKSSAFPPDREKAQALGVVLKAGGYRSAESYLSL